MKFFTELRTSVSKYVAEQKHNWDKRQLESKLAHAIDIAEGHKDVGLPKGHMYYQLLWADAKININKFSEKYGIKFENIAMGVPKLRELEALASDKEDRELGMVLKVSTSAAILGLIGTFLLAMYHNLYVFLTHWAH